MYVYVYVRIDHSSPFPPPSSPYILHLLQSPPPIPSPTLLPFHPSYPILPPLLSLPSSPPLPPVLRRGLAPLAHQLCRSGCPVSHRRQLWCLAMGVDLTDTQVTLTPSHPHKVTFLHLTTDSTIFTLRGSRHPYLNTPFFLTNLL